LLPFISFGQPEILKGTKRKEISYQVKPLYGLNSRYSEFSPVLLDNALIFSSNREFDLVNTGENNWDKNAYYNIFKISYTDQGADSVNFGKAEVFNKQWIGESHTGPIAFSEDGNTAVFTQVVKHALKGKDKVKVHKPLLFYVKKENGKWNDPLLVEFDDPKFSYGHPTLSADGLTLYFSSDMPGGYGADDIYYSHFDNNSWSDPVNMGEKINSSAKEVFPFVIDDQIYFSSDRNGGLGGLDVYLSEIEELKWTEPVNLGNVVNSSADDFSFYLYKNGTFGYFSSNRESSIGMDDIYYVKVIEQIIIEKDFIVGEFNYKTLGNDDPAGLKVLLLDEDGNIVGEAITDENGEFIFRNIDGDKTYLIKLAEGDEDLELTVYNENGVQMARLLSNSKGEYIYKHLPNDKVGSLSMMNLNSETGMGNLDGQFIYENLPNSKPGELSVFLVDEDGNIIAETKTDEYGNFQFKNLPNNVNYLVKLKQGNDELTLLIYNNKDEVKAILRRNGKGEYVYRKISNEAPTNLEMLELSNDELFDDLTNSIYAQFQHSGKQHLMSDLEFMVYDEDLNLVTENSTNQEGIFRIHELPMAKTYKIKLKNDNGNFEDTQLIILNRKGKKVAVLDRDKDGFFVYSPMGLMGGMELSQMDLENTDLDKLLDIPTVYYDKNSYRLSYKWKKELNDLVKFLNENTDKKIEVNSYADSRASEEFNLNLSRKRTNSVVAYLKSKGIPASRISGNAYGESKLLNDCDDGVECPEELHQLNRRSEIRIY
jgi:outer membrane protein OmpA-like peptidoglycan-associated protein